MTEFDLSEVLPQTWIPDAERYLASGDLERVMALMGRQKCPGFVFNNIRALRERGWYEKAVLETHVMADFNNGFRRFLFEFADRGRLRQLAPPPKAGPFTVYRGVNGHGRARVVRNGVSWTGSIECARWFAWWLASEADDPAVFRVDVADADVLAYSNEREGEDEYIVILPPTARPKRIERPAQRPLRSRSAPDTGPGAGAGGQEDSSEP